MGILVENSTFSLRLSLTALRFTGFWPPAGWRKGKLVLYNCYGCFCFMFLLGIFLITEVADLFLIWGNLPLMTGTAFLLFTNLAQATKFLNIVLRRESIVKIITECDQALRDQKNIESCNIVRSCNRETRQQQVFFIILTIFTCAGWFSSAESGKLPLRAWYPYNTNVSPIYEITYFQQVFTILLAALLNVSKDTLVTSLIAQCRCRLQLIGQSLRNFREHCHFGKKPITDTIYQIAVSEDEPLTAAQEIEVYQHFRRCVIEHQRTLKAIMLLEKTFSEPTFAQLSVSLVIICATAFQLVSQSTNYVRLISMGTYLFNMTFQVFIYCYQGHKLSLESEDLAGAVYHMPWYELSVRLRRFLLIIMVRCRFIAKITAGGFTTLSLNSFMTIIKTSYSLFTLLQQVAE